jgi:hypothetical protein
MSSLTTDALKAAFEVSFATEQGDIEIADDVLKAAAFMVALSSAAIYYSLTALEKAAGHIGPTAWPSSLPLLTSVALLALSILLALRVHHFHMRFRALCRNMVIARKMLYSELLERIEEVEKSVQARGVPVWTLVTSGAISEDVHSSALVTFPEPQTKQLLARQKLDRAHRWQKRLFVSGFLLLLAGSLQSTVSRIAA